jgi:hypothetical protein
MPELTDVKSLKRKRRELGNLIIITILNFPSAFYMLLDSPVTTSRGKTTLGVGGQKSPQNY